MKKNKRGFTIVELVIVIAVIGILAAVLIPTFSGVVENANKSAAYSNCRNAMTTVISDSEYGQVKDGTIFVSGDYYAVFKDNQLGEAQKFEWTSDSCTVTVNTKTAKFTKSGDTISLDTTSDYEEGTLGGSEATAELTKLGVKYYVVE